MSQVGVNLLITEGTPWLLNELKKPFQTKLK